MRARALAVLVLAACVACRPAPPTLPQAPAPQAPPDPAPPAGPPPNVVLIISDDHGWTDYGFMGHPAIETPRLDRLAAEGLLFTRGYVPSSLCRPSLATLATGLYPHQHGIFSNDPPHPDGLTGRALLQDPEWRLGRERMIRTFAGLTTLPQMLAESGYRSLQTGKWWEGSYLRGGFTAGMTTGDPDNRGRHGDEGLQIGRRTMQPIVDFLDEAGDDPFFLWYAPLLPHRPHRPPEELFEKYSSRTDSEHVARYWAMVEWLDRTTGELLDELDRRGLSEDTLIVFLADNGWTQSVDSEEAAKGSKSSTYDAGLRTPVILSWPGRIEPERVEVPVHSVDIVPTVLAAAGLSAPAELPGIDLLDRAAVEARPAIFGEVYRHDAINLDNPATSLRFRWCVSDRWKLIVQQSRASPPPELYDLVADPHETRDVAADNPRHVRRLSRMLDGWWTPPRL